MNKLEIKAALSLSSVYMLRMLGLFMIMPVIAVLGKQYPDYSHLLVGLAIGGYGLTQAILQIPMGMLSDRIGRKPVIIGGLVMFALGSWIAASATSLHWVVIGRIIQGAGAIAGAIMALAGDVSREEQRGTMMMIIGISIGLSFYLAVILGPVISHHYGLSGIFYLTAILAVIAIFLVKFVVPEPDHIAPSHDTLPVPADIKALVGNSQLLRLNISVTLLHTTIVLLFIQMPSLIAKAGWPLSEHWKLYLWVLGLSVVGVAPLMRVAKKMAASKPLQLSAGLMALSFAGFLTLPLNVPVIMTLAVIFFIGFTCLESLLPAQVSNIAPAGKKGSAMGIFSSFQFFGSFIGGTVSGLVLQHFGGNWLFTLGLVLCIIWIPLLGGFVGSGRLTRYTLTLDLQRQSAKEIAQQLKGLSGVKDVTIILEEQTAYLKVEDNQFNLQQARQIAGEIA